jgi:hypothetical protein
MLHERAHTACHRDAEIAKNMADMPNKIAAYRVRAELPVRAWPSYKLLLYLAHSPYTGTINAERPLDDFCAESFILQHHFAPFTVQAEA